MLPQTEPTPLTELGLLNFSSNNTWNAVNICETYSFKLGPGRYLIEVWGASGGYNIESVVSKGGYSRGELILVKQTNFYAVAGDVGDSMIKNNNYKIKGGCNGGGDGNDLPPLAQIKSEPAEGAALSLTAEMAPAAKKSTSTRSSKRTSPPS